MLKLFVLVLCLLPSEVSAATIAYTYQGAPMTRVSGPPVVGLPDMADGFTGSMVISEELLGQNLSNATLTLFLGLDNGANSESYPWLLDFTLNQTYFARPVLTDVSIKTDANKNITEWSALLLYDPEGAKVTSANGDYFYMRTYLANQEVDEVDSVWSTTQRGTWTNLALIPQPAPLPLSAIPLPTPLPLLAVALCWLVMASRRRTITSP